MLVNNNCYGHRSYCVGEDIPKNTPWCKDSGSTDIGITPLPHTFKLSAYISICNQISLLFHLFLLILTCSCPYSYNLMLTATYMCRPAGTRCV